MPKLKTDIKKWLMEDMGFTEEEIKAGNLIEAFTPRLDKIDAGYMRQSDYDRVMNEHKTEIEKQRGDLVEAQKRLDAEIAEWATVQADGKKVTDKMRTDLEAAQNDVLRFQQVLRKTAEQTGLQYDDLIKGIEVKPVVKKDEPPPVDLSGYVTRDQYQALSRMALVVPAQLDRIQREHFDLTGEYLNPEDLIAEVQTRAGTAGNKKSLELRDIWEEKYEIPAKREAKAKKEHDDEIAAAEKRGREAALSEANLPMGSGAAAAGHHSPVFREGHKSVLERPAAGLPNQAAVSALRTGKYRQPPAGAPAAK